MVLPTFRITAHWVLVQGAKSDREWNAGFFERLIETNGLLAARERPLFLQLGMSKSKQGQCVAVLGYHEQRRHVNPRVCSHVER